jgi:IS5 family transposase
VPIETMLRTYLLQVWFHLSDEAVEDQISDSYAMRQFMGLHFTVAQVPDATTLFTLREVYAASHPRTGLSSTSHPKPSASPGCN